MTQNTQLELDIDDLEGEESSYVEFDILVTPSDPTLEGISARVERKDIIIPPYQRQYVWDKARASRLIDSFLMGLPVPEVFLYINKERKHEVIDGQQRILTIHYFLTGIFKKDGKEEKFDLVGISEKSPFYKKTFSDLPPEYQRKLRDSVLRFVNVRQLSPALNDRTDSVFHIFERLNTGGMKLTPQEIRNAVYRGETGGGVKKLEALNKLAAWRQLVGNDKPDEHQKDVELILRLFALFRNWQNYTSPMVDFLNKAMDEDRDFESEKAHEFEGKFKEVIAYLVKIFPERTPFRPHGPLNAAVLDGVMIPLLENSLPSEVNFRERYRCLMEGGEFISKELRTSTTGQKSLKDRIALAEKVLIDGEA